MNRKYLYLKGISFIFITTFIFTFMIPNFYIDGSPYVDHFYRSLKLLFVYGIVPIFLMFLLKKFFIKEIKKSNDFKKIFISIYSILPFAGIIQDLLEGMLEEGINTSYYIFMHIATIFNFLILYLMGGVYLFENKEKNK